MNCHINKKLPAPWINFSLVLSISLTWTNCNTCLASSQLSSQATTQFLKTDAWPATFSTLSFAHLRTQATNMASPAPLMDSTKMTVLSAFNLPLCPARKVTSVTAIRWQAAWISWAPPLAETYKSISHLSSSVSHTLSHLLLRQSTHGLSRRRRRSRYPLLKQWARLSRPHTVATPSKTESGMKNSKLSEPLTLKPTWTESRKIVPIWKCTRTLSTLPFQVQRLSSKESSPLWTQMSLSDSTSTFTITFSSHMRLTLLRATKI